MKSPQMEAPPVKADAPTPLFRNRNYNILWSSHFLSDFGSEITFIAFPLLILAVSGSPLQMGLVASVLAAARMVANVPAGVLADRLDRRKIMIGCQAIRVVAMASLAIALALDAYSLTHVLVVAAVEGLFSSVFGPSEDAALPQVVPPSQLSTAVARNTARPFVASLLGPVVAGILFAVSPVIPFAVDTTLLAFSVFALLFLTLPRRARERPSAESGERTTVKGDVAEGFRYVLGNRVIRTTLAWVVFFNLIFHALVIVILAAAGENQVGAGEMGLMMAFLGAGGLIGAMLASRLHAALPSSVIIIGFSWIAAGATALMLVVPSGVMLGVALGVAIFFAPVANTAILTYQMLVTPDELRGRLSGIVGLCTGVAGAIGPLVGGLLMSVSGGGNLGVTLCAIGLGVIAIGTTLSPTLRRFPTLRATDTHEPEAPRDNMHAEGSRS